MDSITRTKHFDRRFQQRGITDVVIWALLYYGERRSSQHGIDSLILTEAALVEIKNEHGSTVLKACEKQRNTYLIVSDNGMLITVARSHRRTIH
jgi:hypothetical protein